MHENTSINLFPVPQPFSTSVVIFVTADYRLYDGIQKWKAAQNLHKTCNNWNDTEQDGKRTIEAKMILMVLNIHFFYSESNHIHVTIVVLIWKCLFYNNGAKMSAYWFHFC